VEFYHATGGDHWYGCCDWELDQPMETWQGLTFNEQGCVTEISIEGVGLRGYLPPEIGDLLSLEHLYIGYADFGGTSIPPEIGNLTNLTYLKLNRNEFEGTIPPEIGDLVNLEQLNLSSNYLHGIIPAELGNLTNLLVLIMGHNELTGAIPEEFSNLKSIVHLSIGSNELSNLPIINHIEPHYVTLINNRFTFKDIIPNMDIMEHVWPAGSYKTQLPIGEATTYTVSAGDEIYINLDIDHEIADNVYVWYKNSIVIDTIIGSPVFQKVIESADDAGTYDCRVTNPRVDSLVLESLDYTVQFEEMTPVHPGDFNNDGRVDGTDALFWGLTYGRTGIQRPDASLQWTPQPCINWNISHLGINGKHQDANGDGIVNEADLDAINSNYGLSAEGEDFSTQEAPISLNYEIVSSVPNDEGLIVNTINLSLVNNTNNDAPISLHGLSFGFEFVSDNMNYVSSDINLLEPLLTEDEDTLTVLHREYADENRASYTITRNDFNDITISNINSDDDEVIAQIIVIADDIQAGDIMSFVLEFNDVKAASASNTAIMSLDASGTTTAPRLEAPRIIEGISPNPTQAATGISLTLNADTDYGDGHIVITDMMGKTIRREPIELLQGIRQLHLATNGLPGGIYTLRLLGDDWHSQTERFIISQ